MRPGASLLVLTPSNQTWEGGEGKREGKGEKGKMRSYLSFQVTEAFAENKFILYNLNL